jgi:hypothetical protein
VTLVVFLHSDMYVELGQVKRRREVEGFHRERWGSCVLLYAMDVRHQCGGQNVGQLCTKRSDASTCPITRGG